MDAVTTAMIAAIAAGAGGGLKDASKAAVLDAYNGLKSLIKNKANAGEDMTQTIERLEAKPDSLGRRQTLAEELGATELVHDPELLEAADSLLRLIKALPHGQQHLQSAVGNAIAQADRGSTAAVNISSSPTKNDGD